ncbi:unnamed protein product [Prorocentrum cordatum]|uniref:Neurotransmitter-gated ion-channel ligand-binding domain-containing protein n=1 Tax=Prorocentrum cordatum TaxID=2364126 RepID=A0ABN9S1N6_9DINO|nr:unnamed protein product [Polarella glacialis]
MCFLVLVASLGWPLAMMPVAAESAFKTTYSTRALPDLFRRFAESMDVHFPPPRDAGDDPVVVKVGITFNHLVSMTPTEEAVELSSWYHLYWNDERLVYNGSQVFGSGWNSEGDYVAMPPQKIWKPDIVPYYPARVDSESTSATNVYAYLFGSEFLRANGYNVHWVRPAIINFHCDIDMSIFPWDSHVCALIVGPWHAKASNHRFLHGKMLAHGDESKLSSEEWDVQVLKIEDVKNEYNTGVYEEVHFTLGFKRYPHYFMVNIILPMLLIMVAASLTLMLPIQDGPGERMAFAATLCLTIMATMLFTAQLRPASNTDTWMDRFQGWCLFFTFLPLLESCIVTLVQHAEDIIKWINRNSPGSAVQTRVTRVTISIQGHLDRGFARHLDHGFAYLYLLALAIVMGFLYYDVPRRDILTLTSSEAVMITPSIATIVPLVSFFLLVLVLKAARRTCRADRGPQETLVIQDIPEYDGGAIESSCSSPRKETLPNNPILSRTLGRPVGWKVNNLGDDVELHDHRCSL